MNRTSFCARVHHHRRISSEDGDMIALKDLIEAGKIKPVIDRTYPLGEAPEASGYLREGHARGKVLITVAPDDNP